MRNERITEAGRLLGEAWLARRPVARFPDALRARSRQAAEISHRRGITLEAGQYVSTGAATDPLPVGPESVVRARFGDLGAIDATFTDT